MRAVVEGGPVSLEAAFWGGGLAVIYLLAACWFFTRTYRYAVRTGLLARYAAESAA
jgi:ABC-2 type transport system permease protein